MQYLDEDKVYQLVLDLTQPVTREHALLELSKRREAYEDLAPILWHAFGALVTWADVSMGLNRPDNQLTESSLLNN